MSTTNGMCSRTPPRTWAAAGVSSTSWPPTSTPRCELPSYDVIDLRAGVDFERFSVELFAKNVTDEYALVSFGGFPLTPQMTPGLLNGAAAVLRPRTIGLVLSARF